RYGFSRFATVTCAGRIMVVPALPLRRYGQGHGDRLRCAAWREGAIGRRPRVDRARQAALAAGRSRREGIGGVFSGPLRRGSGDGRSGGGVRSEEHTSELQSRENLVCRLLLEKK